MADTIAYFSNIMLGVTNRQSEVLENVLQRMAAFEAKLEERRKKGAELAQASH